MAQASWVLVINAGSSSIKYQLMAPDSGTVLAFGLVERIGEPQGRIEHHADGQTFLREERIADQTAGLAVVFQLFAESGRDITDEPIAAVGHRVVHGGAVFYQPTVIDAAVLTTIKELSSLAPLHNPANAAGIEAVRALLPEVPQVAVFDTAFFHDLPAAATTYAIDAELAAEHGIRRYGFHGTSHQYVSEQAANFLGLPVQSVNQIVFHLGNGASASAIRGGAPIDTSMGFTPLEGLVMGTRPGDLDPGITSYLMRTAEMDVAQIDQLLTRGSGLLGLTGANDFRELLRLADAGDSAAQLAYQVYVHRLRRYLGAYLIELNPLDAIVFTAGVGENAPPLRADALADLDHLGITIDPDRNAAPSHAPHRISPPDSPVAVLVIPTNEELAIARATLSTLTTGPPPAETIG